MAWASMIRVGLAGLLFAGGTFGLVRACLTRETPVLRWARLLGCLCSVLFGGALLAAGARHIALTVALVLAGGGCGLSWLAILYANSLHNTTM